MVSEGLLSTPRKGRCGDRREAAAYTVIAHGTHTARNADVQLNFSLLLSLGLQPMD